MDKAAIKRRQKKTSCANFHFLILSFFHFLTYDGGIAVGFELRYATLQGFVGRG